MARFASAGARVALASSALAHALIGGALTGGALIGCGPSDVAPLDAGVADALEPDAYRVPEDAGPPRAIFAVPRGDDATFFDLPWPSDLRLSAEGTVDLTTFPNPRSIPLIERYVATILARQRGFSTNGSIYFRFSRDLDVASLPRSPEESVADGASAFVIDVDESSPDRLARHPITTYFQGDDTLYWESRTLALSPVHGIPLVGGRTYAAVVTRGLRTLDGSTLERDVDFAALVGGGGDSDVERARTAYRGALDAVIEAGVAEDDVLAMAVFTTQDPVADLAIYRDWVRAHLPEPTADEPEWRLAGSRPAYQQIEGRYGPLPIFQEGTIPYENEGGVMEPGADGEPVVQGMISPRFAISVPTTPMPASGYPIVIYAHGTGGDWHSFLSDGTGARLAAAGIATIGVDLIHHGERNPSETTPDLLFVNILNPDAARDNIRQGALDFVQTARFVRSVVIPTAIGMRDIHFDPANVFFFGHSQGALLAPIYMGIDDGVRGGVVSAGGAVIGYALLGKVEPVSIPGVLRIALGLPGATVEEAFAREGFGFPHPVVTMLQGWIDGADPANFGHLAFAAPRPGFAPKSVLSTEGMEDPYAPPGSIEALAVSMHVPQVEPIVRRVPAYDLLGIGVDSVPVSANVAGGAATAGLMQYADQGHFVVFDDRSAQARIRGFFETMIAAGVPTIPAP